MSGPDSIPPPDQDREPPRRNFLAAAAAVVVGAIISIFPVAAGLGVLFDPVARSRGRGKGPRWVKLGPPDLVPPDGKPHFFKLIDDVVDAWNFTPDQAIGSVYVMRTESNGKSQYTCYSAYCPHFGCIYDYQPKQNDFHCPCHNSIFALDGEFVSGVSPRPLDTLKIEVRKNKEEDGQEELWVGYEKFKASVPEKVQV